LRYSGIIFVSTAEPDTRSHSLINGFLSKGGSMQPLAWAFIVTLKRDCCMSSAEEDSSSPQVSVGNSRGPCACWLLVPQYCLFNTCRCFGNASSAPSCNQYCGYSIPNAERMSDEGNRFSNSCINISAISARHRSNQTCKAEFHNGKPCTTPCSFQN
jgi:hypothetical protein